MLFTNKKHAVMSSERAHNITWYKQKRRRNRWASKQVSRWYTHGSKESGRIHIRNDLKFQTSIHFISYSRYAAFVKLLYFFNEVCPKQSISYSRNHITLLNFNNSTSYFLFHWTSQRKLKPRYIVPILTSRFELCSFLYTHSKWMFTVDTGWTVYLLLKSN